ncbi:hypothetical protein ACTFIT_009207 [Dictyostelium discoideum]
MSEGDLGFASLGLNEQLINNIKRYGITKLTPFQMEVIKEIKENSNVIVDSIEGTGRTISLIIGTLDKIDETKQQQEQEQQERQQTDQQFSFPQILMILPTKELSQTTKVIYSSLGGGENNNNDFKVLSCIGGVKISMDIEILKKGNTQILLGTPGRISDLFSRKRFDTDNIKILVFDELDEILSRGFECQLEDIIKPLNNNNNLQIIVSTSGINELTSNFINTFIKIPKIIKSQQEPYKF